MSEQNDKKKEQTMIDELANYKINLSKMKQTKQFITQLILLYHHQFIFF